MTTPDRTPAAGDPLAEYMAAVEKVRQLAAAGLISAEALGLPAAPVALPHANLVPGERINLPDLAAKTLAGLKASSRRTYGSYITFLVHGWPLEAPPEEKLYPGLASKYQWADEVLPSDLEEALRAVEARALASAAVKADNRRAAGREVQETNGTGAKYNAVGAWRRMFKV